MYGIVYVKNTNEVRRVIVPSPGTSLDVHPLGPDEVMIAQEGDGPLDLESLNAIIEASK